MLCKCSGKYIDIYFILKIKFFLNVILKTSAIVLPSDVASCVCLNSWLNLISYWKCITTIVSCDWILILNSMGSI